MKNLTTLLSLAVCVPLAGCVTKATAEAQARAAFLAGQQSERVHELSQAPSINLLGPVQSPRIPWHQDLTLAQALIEAQYLPKTDPSLIVILRQGKAILVTPKQLLGGEDIPLQSGDVIDIKP